MTYTAVEDPRWRLLRGIMHGKGGEPMCYSSCFIQATQKAFVQNRLQQCRTCGSQAFHVMDCCRNPDYVPVATSHVAATLKGWLSRIWMRLRMPQRARHQPAQLASPERLDAWEARPLLTMETGRTRQLRVGDTDSAAEPKMQETIAAGR